MDKIALEELAEGKYFTHPLYLDKSFILLNSDLPVTKEMIARLKRWGFNSLLSEGTQVSQSPVIKEAFRMAVQTAAHKKTQPIPSTEQPKTEEKKNLSTEKQPTPLPKEKETPSFIVDQEPQTVEIKEEVEKRNSSLEYYLTSLNFFSRIYKEFAVTRHLNVKTISDKIVEMHDALKSDKDTFLHLPDVRANNYVIVDSVKSAYYAMALAELIKLPTHRQIDVGIAAVLHDIGMFLIPSALYLHDRKLTAAEISKIREHVNLGVKAIKEAGFSNEIVQAVQEHHECYDGSGYPFRSTGNTISIYGRILGIICSYVAMTSNRLFRSKRNAHSGVIDILQKVNTLYDPTITKAFVLMLSLYPLGCFVELANGQIGVVIKTSIENPKGPIVKLVLDENKKIRIPFKAIQSGQGSALIKNALSDEEVKKIKEQFKEEGLLERHLDLFQN